MRDHVARREIINTITIEITITTELLTITNATVGKEVEVERKVTNHALIGRITSAGEDHLANSSMKVMTISKKELLI